MGNGATGGGSSGGGTSGAGGGSTTGGGGGSGTGGGSVAMFDAGVPMGLVNGTPVVVSGPTASKRYFIITLTAPSALHIETANGTGDVDLYFKAGVLPSTDNFQLSSITTGVSEQLDTQTLPPGVYYVMVYGTAAYANVNLVAFW
jgi:hypothetical protein